MLEDLKKKVCEANLLLPRYHLVTFTWGNVSGFDREQKVFAIKPSGVPYEELRPEMMVLVNLDGQVVEGSLRPSSDTPTHVVLYRSFPDIGGIVHTHSTWATAWAQTGRGVPCYGTTHADYFYGDIPCTRMLTEEEINEGYETNTGKVIVETFNDLDCKAQPGVLCHSHGVFSWGKDPAEAVYHAKVIEEVAKMAAITKFLVPDVRPVPQYLLDKHYERKHGPHAYYGQRKD